MKNLLLLLLLFATACSVGSIDTETINKKLFKKCSKIYDLKLSNKQLKYIERSSRPYHFPGVPFDDDHVCFVRRDFKTFSIVRISYPQLNHHGSLWYVAFRSDNENIELKKLYLTGLNNDSFINLKKNGILRPEDWKELHKWSDKLDSVTFKEAAIREFDIGL